MCFQAHRLPSVNPDKPYFTFIIENYEYEFTHGFTIRTEVIFKVDSGGTAFGLHLSPYHVDKLKLEPAVPRETSPFGTWTGSSVALRFQPVRCIVPFHDGYRKIKIIDDVWVDENAYQNFQPISHSYSSASSSSITSSSSSLSSSALATTPPGRPVRHILHGSPPRPFEDEGQKATLGWVAIRSLGLHLNGATGDLEFEEDFEQL